MQNQYSIGIYDSGIGGLTVAKAITNLLPHENIIYFGDTAHLPYGDKSTAAIQAYSVKICNLLLEQNCKVIVIACNSASAAAYSLVKEYVGSKAKVISVIEPAVKYLGKHYAQRKVGLIGTKKTIGSNVYKKKIDKLMEGIELHSLATPLLAPMIEEGFFDNTISKNIIHQYLSSPELDGIEALVLACTHYPLIKNEIDEYYQNKVNVIDTSEIVADTLKEYLKENQLLNKQSTPATKKFYVSDYTRSFEESTKLFFNEEVHLELYPLWQ